MNHTVFITGANRGIGLSLVKCYLEQGWLVHASTREPHQAKALLELADKYTSLSIHQLDVTDYNQVKHLSKRLNHLDLLINNAGYYGPKGYSFGNTDVAEWRKVIEINTIAPLKLVESFSPLFNNSQIKKIACLSSKVGSMADNSSGGGYIYRSSKAALNSVVKSLSLDLKPQGITVLALHPGWVQTEMGGPNALIDTATSAQGLFTVINNAHLNDSGKFFDYQGKSIPW